MTNQKGFAVVPIIITLAIIGVIGGYFAFNSEAFTSYLLPSRNNVEKAVPQEQTPVPSSQSEVNTPPGPENLENARTFYEGRVGIQPISLVEIKTKLKNKNIIYADNGESLTVYPHGGPGFGPLSLTLTKDTLKTDKDIPGTPDPEKYKQAVRQDVKDIGGIITIKENTWEIKTTYPWTAVY